MSVDRFDYSSERQRHEKFVGRAGLLTRLDQLLVDSETDRWVVITGGPGMGKSALLAAWLARREAAGAVVPHHFIRRAAYDWDDPVKLVGSLVAQITERFPDLCEPDGDERMHPATRLARALSRVSENVLRPRGERMIVLIDGLDEYDPSARSSADDPLAAFLPDALPHGVRLLCASRPRHPYVSSLEARDGELVQLDLDDPGYAADNDATVRTFWEQAAELLGLDVRFVDEAVARAGGNVQHAVQLRKHLAVLAPEQRRVEDIPRGLAALIDKSWSRIAVDATAVEGLGILCAAREGLTLDDLGAVAGWTGDAQRRTFVRSAKELLVETLRPDGQPEYRLHHDSLREHIARAIGDVALRGHHRALAQRHATWPAHSGMAARQYALRHALIHHAEAGEWADAWRLAADTTFLEAKCRELGAHETEADVARVAERCRARGDVVTARRFEDLTRALARESHWLRDAPEVTAALVWNRLRRSGWSENDLDGELRVPVEASFLRLRHAAMRDSPALVRDLVGHSGVVTACAVTADSRHVVSASVDKTLKVWELETGRVLATLRGHTDWVTACAATVSGGRVVSASQDRTLRVWELETGRLLATLRGHTRPVRACAVTVDGRCVISASHDRTLRVWDLDSGRALATLKGHTGWVTACAVTPDGRRVISASEDKTLKVWDLKSGGSVLATLEAHARGVRACAVTPDGRRVVSASEDKTLKIWDLDSGRVIATLEGHTDEVTACAVTGDGLRVISASRDRTLKIWDLDSRRVIATLTGHTAAVKACAPTRDSRRVVSASADRTLKIWDLEAGHALASPQGHASRVRACAVTIDGQRAVSASQDRTLKIWDLHSGRALHTLEGHTNWVRACAVTMDGQRAISASQDRTLKIWDLHSGRDLATLKGHTDWVRACVVTSDGRRVISASQDQTLKVWDLESRHVIATLEGHTDLVRACAVTSDGRRVISASQDQTLKVWDLETRRELATLKGHTGGVWTCAVTGDSRRVVSGSQDRTLKIWDLESGRVVATLEGHTHWVWACAVTTNDRCVISASQDRTLKIWDLETHACLLTHRGDAPYHAVAASATAVVAGDTAGGVWIFDWAPSTRNTRAHHASGADDSQRASHPPRTIPSPRPPVKKHTILFLAANPVGIDRLALDREAREIQMELERTGNRDQFELVTRWAAQPLDLLRELRKLKPTVVHFSGHAGGSGHRAHPPVQPPRQDAARATDERSDLDDEYSHGLFFHGPDGQPRLVSTATLEETFGAAGSSVKVVVLNACYSEVQAEALVAHIDCVVGMGGSVDDDAARHFAVGFYGGLGERESVAAAYKQGCAAISLEGLRDSAQPKLKVRAGVDAGHLVLAGDASWPLQDRT